MLSQVFEELVKFHRSTVHENQILTKDGRELLVVWHSRPIFTKDGEFAFFLGLGIDIAKQKSLLRKPFPPLIFNPNLLVLSILP